MDGSNGTRQCGLLGLCGPRRFGGRMGWGLGLGRSLGRSADGRFANEDGPGFDRERLGFDITDNLSAGFQLDAIQGRDVAVDFSINDHSGSFDFGLESGVFTHSEAAIGGDLPFDLAVNDQVIGELDGAFDFNIRGKNVAGSSHRWPGKGRLGRCGRRDHMTGWWCQRFGLPVTSCWSRGWTMRVVLTNDFLKHGVWGELELMNVKRL